jgi:hypothetical protein
LARFKYGDSSPHRNLEEEVKFSIWQKNDTVSDDVNFSYNFIKNNPHEETIKQITKDIEDDLFATHRVSNANPRLKSLAATLIFKDFLSFYDKSDDRAAILHKFSTLAPIYQKLIKVSISKAGGKQAAPLGDWAMEEMKSNMKGPLVSSAIKKIKELSPVTLEKANSILVQLALFEFIEIVEGNAQSSNDVIRVLNNLDKEFFEDDHWSVAKWIKCRVWEQIDPLNWVKCKKERDGIEYIRFDEVHEKQAFNFIKENPHDQIIIMAINKL